MRALVISTGIIYQVISEFDILHLTINIPIGINDDPDHDKSHIVKNDHLDNSTHYYNYKAANGKSNPGKYYTLPDGSTYNKTELIVGDDKIRDYKLDIII